MDSARSFRRTSFLYGERLARTKQPTDNRLDDALVFELGVRLRDSISVHPQVLRQRPNGRQGLAGLQRTGRGRELYLVDQLQVDGFTRFEIELELH